MALAQPQDSGSQGMHGQEARRISRVGWIKRSGSTLYLRLADTAFRALTHPTGYKPYIPDLY